MAQVFVGRLAVEAEQIPFVIDRLMMKNAVHESRPWRQSRLAHDQSSPRLDRRDRPTQKVERPLQVMQYVKNNDVSGRVRCQRESVRVHDHIDPGTRRENVGRYDVVIVAFEVARSGADFDYRTLTGKETGTLRIPVVVQQAKHRLTQPDVSLPLDLRRIVRRSGI